MAKVYRKNIIFTHSQLTGIYKYKDVFQLYPLNIEKAPRSQHAEEIPCCIEYYYLTEDIAEVKPFNNDHLDEMVTSTAAETNKRNKILNLLSAVTNFRFKLDGKINLVWAIPLPEDFKTNPDELNNSSSRNSMEGYMYPGIGKDLKITEFSNISVEPIQFLEHKRYFLYDPLDDDTQTIRFPNTIEKILDKYFSLDDSSSKIIDSAAFQICNSLDLKEEMKSLSFFSAVSAIETLIKLEYKGEKIEFDCNNCKALKTSHPQKCAVCGRPTWGIAEKFRNFLATYLSPHKEAIKKYSKIYNVRSKITHTEYLLFHENVRDWTFKNAPTDLILLHMEAIQFSRKALANFLLMKTF